MRNEWLQNFCIFYDLFEDSVHIVWNKSTLMVQKVFLCTNQCQVSWLDVEGFDNFTCFWASDGTVMLTYQYNTKGKPRFEIVSEV